MRPVFFLPSISVAYLPLATAATAVGGGHGGAAGLAVPRDQTVLRGAARGGDGYREDGIFSINKKDIIEIQLFYVV